MMKRSGSNNKSQKWKINLSLFVIIIAIGFGIWIGKQNIFRITSKSNETQVITAMKKQEQVAILGLSVTDIYDKTQINNFLGMEIPFSDKTVFIKGTFDAKLGFDGKDVKISKDTKENTYNISIPKFIVVGISNPNFEVVDTKGSILSFATKDIDTHELANNAMNDETLEKYILPNEEWLKEQSKDYYERILKSVDPKAQLNITFE